jgi:hypothetical protein
LHPADLDFLGKETRTGMAEHFSDTLPCQQGHQIFLGPNIPKREKYTKLTQTIPNGHIHIIPSGHKLYQTASKYTNSFHFKAPQNILKNWIFGLKISLLAALPVSPVSFLAFPPHAGGVLRTVTCKGKR